MRQLRKFCVVALPMPHRERAASVLLIYTEISNAVPIEEKKRSGGHLTTPACREPLTVTIVKTVYKSDQAVRPTCIACISSNLSAV
jgi:hypothetical protein